MLIRILISILVFSAFTYSVEALCAKNPLVQVRRELPKTKTQIRKARGTKAKLAVVRKLDRKIDKALVWRKSHKLKNTQDEFWVRLLKENLDIVTQRPFKRSKCENYKIAIKVGFNPRSENPKLRGPTKDVYDIVKMLCK